MALLPLSKILDQATKSFLLENKTEFFAPLQLTSVRKADINRLEEEIRDTGFLKVTRYRNEKEGFTRVGRPVEVSFTSKDLLKKRPEIKRVRANWEEAQAIAKTFDLAPFLKNEYTQCLRKAVILPACVRVLEYLQSSSESIKGYYPRQIPHGESTKLIGHEPLLLQLFRYVHPLSSGLSPGLSPGSTGWDDFYHFYGLKQKQQAFQFYADQIELDGVAHNHFYGLIDPDLATRFRFGHQPALIIENEESFHSLRGILQGTVLILGSGKSIAGGDFLKESLVGPVFYWGDIDKAGYEIFRSVYALFPTVVPVCMDLRTIEKYAALIQKMSCEEPSQGLMPILQLEYEKVCKEGIRIEQEQILLEDVIASCRKGE